MTDRPTILIVDDNNLVRKVLTDLLTQTGFNVLSARDGYAAEELLKREGTNLACALIDLSLPEVSGEQVVLSLRKILPALPVMIISAYPQAQMTATLTAIGADAYLQKPFDRSEVLDALNALIGE